MALRARTLSGAFEKRAPGRGHCVMFLGKTLNSHSASLHLGAYMGTGKFNAGGGLMLGVANSTARWTRLYCQKVATNTSQERATYI